MKPNINDKGRLLRATLALLLLAAALWQRSWLLLLASAFTLCESFCSWCILYALIGKNDCHCARRD